MDEKSHLPSSIGVPDSPQQHEATRHGYNQGRRGSHRSICTPSTCTLVCLVAGGLVAGALNLEPLLVFVFSLCSISALAILLRASIDDLCWFIRDHQWRLVLRNASVGIVQFVVYAVALRAGEAQLVQVALLGSVLFYRVLIFGYCLIIEPGEDDPIPSGSSSIILAASAILLIPAILNAVLEDKGSVVLVDSLNIVSYGTAAILLGLYLTYVRLQIQTTTTTAPGEENCLLEHPYHHSEPRASTTTWSSLPFSVATLTALIAALVLSANYLIDSIPSTISDSHLPRHLIGLILLPALSTILGSLSEARQLPHAHSDSHSRLLLSLSAHGALQSMLLLAPFLVPLSCIFSTPIPLQFQAFETTVFIVSNLAVAFVKWDVRTNRVAGIMLFGMYAVIAFSSCFWAADK